MAILVESGRAAVAASIKAQPIHLAWGSGQVGWDAAKPAEQTGTKALDNELGRRIVSYSSFVEPNSSGQVIVSQGRFAETTTATKYLYLRFQFDFADAQQATIRELGIFVGTTPNAGVTGLDYMDKGQYSGGQLLVLEYIDKLVRSSSIRQQFEFVIQF
ncbi:hypothetical protein EX011_21420 [Salmonella enterica]|nr:hypothetical protein [Salmonella enterica]